MRIAVSYLFQPIFIELDPILYDYVRYQFHHRITRVEIVVVPHKVITLLQPDVLQVKLSWPENVYLVTDIPFSHFCPAWLQERYVVIYLIPYRKKKRGASSCRSFHGVRPSHCPSSRNEQRGLAPRKVYIQWCSLTIGYNCGCTSSTKRIFAYTLQGAFPVALFLTWWLEFAKFYTVKTKASRKRLFQYVLSCPQAKDILDDGDTFHYDTLSLRWPHLLKPFTAIMSIGHVFYADVTPCLLFFRFTIYLSSLSSFSSGNESQWSTGGR